MDNVPGHGMRAMAITMAMARNGAMVPKTNVNLLVETATAAETRV